MASKKSRRAVVQLLDELDQLGAAFLAIVEAAFVGFPQGGEQATEARGRAGAAQDGAFKVAGAVAELDQFQPAARQRVLQEGQEAERVGVLDGALRCQAQIGADGGSARGRPPESSTAMSQRSSAVATRRARLRSGVMSAAVRPGISSA